MKRLRYAEAADYIGISVPTLKLWVYAKRVPHYRIGKAVHFAVSDLDKFIEENRVEAA